MTGAREMRSHGETGRQVVAGLVGGGSPAHFETSLWSQAIPSERVPDALAISSRLRLLNH